MSNPLISIIICCYNRAHFVVKALESALRQNYQPVEIIVYDDGSTDGTKDLMRNYGNKIRYAWNENQGIARARNNACRMVNGDFITFLDDDDLMPENKLDTLYSAIKEAPQAVMAVGDWAGIDTDGDLTGERWLPRGKLSIDRPVTFNDGYEAVLWPRVPASPHTTLFRRKDGEKIGWFDTEFKVASEDKDFYARLGKLGPIVYVPEIVSLYRRGHESLTANNLTIEFHRIALFEKHMKLYRDHSLRLRKQLLRRILLSLKRIVRYADVTEGYSKTVLKNYMARGIVLLPALGKAQYYYFKFFRYPIVKTVKQIRKSGKALLG